MLKLDARSLALSDGAFAEEIVADLREEFGLDLMPILTAAIPHKQRKKTAVSHLFEAIIERADREGHLADWNADRDDAAHDETLEKLLSDDVDIEPNYSIVPSDLKTIIAYRDSAVKEYVFMLTKRFENAAKAKSAGQAAIEIVGGGVVGVGVPAAVIAIKAYRAGSTILAAARAGITGVGMKTAIGVIVIALIGLLLFLLWENPKKLLGIVINDTDEELNVKDWRNGLSGADNSDLYMEHGKMDSFMVDHENGLSSPEVQVRARIDFGDQDPENFAFAGIYFADRNVGLRGAEGVMVFTSKTSSKRIATMFACPYTKDNGTNMDIIGSGESAKSVFRSLYDGREKTMSRTKDGLYLQSSVNDTRGGIVACISYIAKA